MSIFIKYTARQLCSRIGATKKKALQNYNNGMRVNRMCLRCIIWQRVGKKTALSLNYLNAIESAAVAGRSSNCSATYIFMLALFAHLTFVHVAYIVWIVWCYMG